MLFEDILSASGANVLRLSRPCVAFEAFVHAARGASRLEGQKARARVRLSSFPDVVQGIDEVAVVAEAACGCVRDVGTVLCLAAAPCGARATAR